jgi:hypothetical protein
MRFYEVNQAFFGTHAEAHDAAKLVTPRSAAFIDEVEVPTDKAGVTQLLNTPQGQRFYPTLRSWSLSVRGGLVVAAPRGDDIAIDAIGEFEPIDAEWATVSAHFKMDIDQFPGDDAMRRVVIASYRRLNGYQRPVVDGDDDIGL